MFQYDKIVINPNFENLKQHKIIVYKNKLGDRKMQFDNNINQNVFQSSYNIHDLDQFNLKYLNFVILLFLYVKSQKTFLIIGLGGGHLPMFIKSKINDALIDVVELNKQVLTGAKEMGYNLDNVIIQNGVDYVKKCNKIYEIIIIDLDEEESYQKFNFQEISNIIDNNGILVVNSYVKNGKSKLRNKLKQSFPLIMHFIDGNSNVFLCKKNIDMFENMLNKIILNTLDQNKILSSFKYKNNLINVIEISKISIILN